MLHALEEATETEASTELAFFATAVPYVPSITSYMGEAISGAGTRPLRCQLLPDHCAKLPFGEKRTHFRMSVVETLLP